MLVYTGVMVPVQALILLLPLAFPAAYLLGQWLGYPNLWALLPLAVTELVLPVADRLLGLDHRNPDEATERRWRGSRHGGALPFVCAAAHLALLGYGGWVLLALTPFNAFGAVVWTLGLGHYSGFLAINTAHELIHRRSRLARNIGGLLLSTVCYGTFKVEHLRGHHVDVATPNDPSSARLGESIYRFLPRAIGGNLVKAWRLESRRLDALGSSGWHWRNELWWWTGLSLVWLSLFWLAAGLAGAAFFVGQSLAAIASLETVNYIEHYGLRRQRLADGRYERPGLGHSWNSAHRLTNAMLLNLGRHSDHHVHAGRPYPLLRDTPQAPQLPAGYATMMQLAMIPPLWRRVMHPRIP